MEHLAKLMVIPSLSQLIGGQHLHFHVAIIFPSQLRSG
jgi:hypothetical protein